MKTNVTDYFIEGLKIVYIRSNVTKRMFETMQTSPYLISM